MKIIAAIEKPVLIAKILAHLWLPTTALPQALTRPFDLIETL